MIVFDLTARELIPVLDFESRNSRAVELATGFGEAHAHVVEISAGGGHSISAR
ncbi:MAG TPA: hypothetical protein VI259_28435 [Gemmatimonadaceae bacterium]